MRSLFFLTALCIIAGAHATNCAQDGSSYSYTETVSGDGHLSQLDTCHCVL